MDTHEHEKANAAGMHSTQVQVAGARPQYIEHKPQRSCDAQQEQRVLMCAVGVSETL